MSEYVDRAVKSTQEQAVASWITYLNQIRLDELIAELDRQDINFEEALAELEKIKKFISDPSHILGSPKTKHGEIAEHVQVNIANARQLIRGLSRNHSFDGVGRLDRVDYMRDGQEVQSKFYHELDHTFFRHHGLKEHLETYPDFVKNGGSYDIPKDQYEKMVKILDMYENDRSKLSTSDYYLAKKIDEYLKKTGLELGKDINPAVAKYDEVQQGAADKTIQKEEKNIREEDMKQRKKAYYDSKPTLKEGIKATGVSAAVEGGVAFCMSVAKKRKEKKFSNFTIDDWKEIGIDTGGGTVKGGIRGGTIYIMTNFTATPANVASAYVTAAFGVAAQVKALEEGRVNEEDFFINCETVCLDVTISAIASAAGQFLIPIPILGAVIGNIAGEFVYELCRKQCTARSRKIIDSYNAEMQQLKQQLEIKQLQVTIEIQKLLKRFIDLERFAFDEDVNNAFAGSINLALEVGVQDKKIIKNMDDINNYFLN